MICRWIDSRAGANPKTVWIQMRSPARQLKAPATVFWRTQRAESKVREALTANVFLTRPDGYLFWS